MTTRIVHQHATSPLHNLSLVAHWSDEITMEKNFVKSFFFTIMSPSFGIYVHVGQRIPVGGAVCEEWHDTQIKYAIVAVDLNPFSASCSKLLLFEGLSAILV